MTAVLSGAAFALAVALADRGPAGRARLQLAGLSGSPPQPPVVAAVAAAGLLVLVAATAGWPLPAVLIPALMGGVGCWAARSVPVRRRRERLTAAVPEATTALAAELRAGAHPTAALSAVAEAAPPLREVLVAAAAESRQGRSAAAVLRSAARRDRVAPLAHLAAAWTAAEEAGAGVAGVLERLGTALDADQEASSRMRARLAGPRATVVLLAGLPVLGLGLGQAVGADPLALLFGRPLGWALCTGAAVLDALGVAWTMRIVRGVAGTGRSP